MYLGREGEQEQLALPCSFGRQNECKPASARPQVLASPNHPNIPRFTASTIRPNGVIASLRSRSRGMRDHDGLDEVIPMSGLRTRKHTRPQFGI